MRNKPSGFKGFTGLLTAATLALGLSLGLGVAAGTSLTAGGSATGAVTLADNQGPTSVTP
ncbi:hypothetical protein [Streptomyces sp. NPDC048277]|uniref:hypothetical protein n=1 Tax=Streptomyces sp. NPDC048277 TaxID=3155027 RepID=UPI0033F3D232